MKAVRLHAYGQRPTLEEVADPKITGPHDVVVRIGGLFERRPLPVSVQADGFHGGYFF